MVIPVKELLLAVSVSAFTYAPKPNTTKTPGHLCTDENPDFEEYRYDEEIPYCHRNVSEARKRKIYESYGVPEDERGDYTIDHLIPLSIGGSNEPSNLWSEHKRVKATRPSTETDIFLAVKDGRMTQDEAVEFILRCKFLIATCDVPD